MANEQRASGEHANERASTKSLEQHQHAQQALRGGKAAKRRLASERAAAASGGERRRAAASEERASVEYANERAGQESLEQHQHAHPVHSMHYALCAKHKLPYDGKVLRRAECAAAGSARAAEPPASGAMGSTARIGHAAAAAAKKRTLHQLKNATLPERAATTTSGRAIVRRRRRRRQKKKRREAAAAAARERIVTNT